jgi:hypothetical protein
LANIGLEEDIMHRTIVAAITSLMLFLGAICALAAEFGTAEEAKAMLSRAIVEVKADKTAAIAKFNKPDGGFRDRDLYVFCFDVATGIRLAHATTDLIGKDLRLTKQKDGSPLGERVFDAANTVKEGEFASVSYSFPRPGTTDPVAKESFVTRVGGIACGVGYYK